MSGFFKYVVFKPQEYLAEIQKSKQIYQTKKIGNLGSFSDLNNERCLIIANLSFKKPMGVDFINKACSKLLKYQQSEVASLRINQFMPSLIAEQHHKIVDRFLQTGKASLLNTKREIFVKSRSGYIIPVMSYLCIN